MTQAKKTQAKKTSATKTSAKKAPQRPAKGSANAASGAAPLSRQEACDALGITPDLLDKLERSGALAPASDGTLEPLAVAHAAVRYGSRQAEAADVKLSEVGAALMDVKPALERLAVLADRAGLSGDTHNRVMVEVAAFFTAFADVMNRATAALKSEDEA
jgi:hypothetical protein